MQHILFLILTVLSHIGASLFFAKPRFNKIITVAIWLVYGVVFLLLPPDVAYVSYFISFALHLVLFFITTTGRTVEKGFLFFSYATTYTCFSTLFNMGEGPGRTPCPRTHPGAPFPPGHDCAEAVPEVTLIGGSSAPCPQ